MAAPISVVTTVKRGQPGVGTRRRGAGDRSRDGGGGDRSRDGRGRRRLSPRGAPGGSWPRRVNTASRMDGARAGCSRVSHLAALGELARAWMAASVDSIAQAMLDRRGGDARAASHRARRRLGRAVGMARDPPRHPPRRGGRRGAPRGRRERRRGPRSAPGRGARTVPARGPPTRKAARPSSESSARLTPSRKWPASCTPLRSWSPATVPGSASSCAARSPREYAARSPRRGRRGRFGRVTGIPPRHNGTGHTTGDVSTGRGLRLERVTRGRWAPWSNPAPPPRPQGHESRGCRPCNSR